MIIEQLDECPKNLNLDSLSEDLVSLNAALISLVSQWE